MKGWIKLHTKMLDWGWMEEPNTLVVFVHLLLSANFKDGEWKGFPVKRGQLITGRKSLAEKTGLTEKQVRTALKNLIKTGEIKIKTSKQNSTITIVLWDDYQLDSSGQCGQQKGQPEPFSSEDLQATQGQAKGQQTYFYPKNVQKSENTVSKMGQQKGQQKGQPEPFSSEDLQATQGQAKGQAKGQERATEEEIYSYLIKKENKKEKNAPENSKISFKALEHEFETWYRAFPRHEARGNAERAYIKARKMATAEALLEGAIRYASVPREKKFTKLPATWLNHKCWMDELPSQTGKPAAIAAEPTDHRSRILAAKEIKNFFTGEIISTKELKPNPHSTIVYRNGMIFDIEEWQVLK